MANLDGTDNIFDSREVIERIAELTAEFDEATETDSSDFTMSVDDWKAGLSEDDAEELVALLELQEEANNYISNWPYGETFISEDYFEEYCEELAYDIGAIDREASWPLNRIDWTAAANDLNIDYTEFEFRGTTYYAR